VDKAECIRPGPFHTGPRKTITDVEYAAMGWVDWYNFRRLHSALNYATPAKIEANYCANQGDDQPVEANN